MIIRRHNSRGRRWALCGKEGGREEGTRGPWRGGGEGNPAEMRESEREKKKERARDVIKMKGGNDGG